MPKDATSENTNSKTKKRTFIYFSHPPPFCIISFFLFAFGFRFSYTPPFIRASKPIDLPSPPVRLEETTIPHSFFFVFLLLLIIIIFIVVDVDRMESCNLKNLRRLAEWEGVSGKRKKSG